MRTKSIKNAKRTTKKGDKRMSWKDMNRSQIRNVILVFATGMGLLLGLTINDTNVILFSGFLMLATTLNSKWWNHKKITKNKFNKLFLL